MPLYVNRETISRLVGRLKLREQIDIPTLILELGRTVQPTVSIDRLLRKVLAQSVGGGVTATGFNAAFAVGAGKRWWVHSFVWVLSAGTWTANSVSCVSLAGITSGYQTNFTSGTSGAHIFDGKRMEAGDQIGLGIDSVAVNGNYNAYLWVEEEDVDA